MVSAKLPFFIFVLLFGYCCQSTTWNTNLKSNSSSAVSAMFDSSVDWKKRGGQLPNTPTDCSLCLNAHCLIVGATVHQCLISSTNYRRTINMQFKVWKCVCLRLCRRVGLSGDHLWACAICRPLCNDCSYSLFPFPKCLLMGPLKFLSLSFLSWSRLPGLLPCTATGTTTMMITLQWSATGWAHSLPKWWPLIGSWKLLWHCLFSVLMMIS